MEELRLNQGQQEVFDFIKEGHNVFCQGVGGTGKSFLISKIQQEYPTDTIFLSTTGISAVNIKGETFHSAMSIPLGHPTVKELNKMSKKTERLFSRGKVVRIIVDEASMITPGGFYAFSQRLKKFNKKVLRRHNKEIQVVFFCDMGQLGPIIDNEERQLAINDYGTDKFYRMRQFENLNFKFVELTQGMRQDNEEMREMLSRIRRGSGVEVQRVGKGGKHVTVRKLNEDVLESIKWFNDNCFKKDYSISDSVVIATTNATVAKYNEEVFKNNDNPCVEYEADVFGDYKKKDWPVDASLQLKEGLKVIILRNSQDGTYVNGSTGTVEFLDVSEVSVLLDKPLNPLIPSVCIERSTWDNRGYDIEEGEDGEEELVQKTIGTFTQIPLKQCSAISGHRSQGQTLDKAVFDKGWSSGWANGLTYVCLSRLKTIEGLRLLKKLSPTDVVADWDALGWLEEMFNNQNDDKMVIENHSVDIDIPPELL